MKNKLYRKAYDAHMGIKNETLAYDFWCKGWDAAVAEIRHNQSVAQVAHIPTDKTKHYKALR